MALETGTVSIWGSNKRKTATGASTNFSMDGRGGVGGVRGRGAESYRLMLKSFKNVRTDGSRAKGLWTAREVSFN